MSISAVSSLAVFKRKYVINHFTLVIKRYCALFVTIFSLHQNLNEVNSLDKVCDILINAIQTHNNYAAITFKTLRPLHVTWLSRTNFISQNMEQRLKNFDTKQLHEEH